MEGRRSLRRQIPARRAAISLLGAVLVLAGCRGTDEPLPTTRTMGRPIVGGSPDNNPAHMAVVALTHGPSTGFFCSGTLITQSVVLTAAHCVSGSSSSSLQVYFGQDVYSGGTYRQVSEIAVHPDYDSYNIEDDIALLRLGSSAPSTIAPIPYLTATLQLTANDEGGPVEFSGFGITEYNSGGQKLHATSSIGRVCPGPGSCSYGGAWVAPRAFGYPQQPGGPCSGDSGGPAFIIRNNQEYVAGVTSYGDANCSDYGVSTKVDAHTGFIASFVGGGTGVEDCVASGDEDGDGLTDCDDPDCFNDPICQGPNACDNAAAVGCGDQISSTTVGGSTAFTWYSCLNQSTENGPEVAYRVVVPASVQVTVTLTPQGGNDLDLFLLPDSNGTCDVNSCIDASLNANNSTESLAFNMPAGGAFLVVDTWDTAGPFALSISCDQDVENCTNGLDDNGNGQVDCSDAECAAHPACQPVPEECGNGLDDDGDGLRDCDDPDCANHPECRPDPDGGAPADPDGGTPDPGPDPDPQAHSDPEYDPGFRSVSGGCSHAPRGATPLSTVLLVLLLMSLSLAARTRG